MKRLLALLLALLLLPVCPVFAASSLKLTADGYTVHYEFSYSGDEFAILEYTAPTEKGNTVLYGKGGHFEGDIHLRCSQAGGTVKVTAKKLSGGVIAEGKVSVKKDPSYRAPSGPSTYKVKGLTLTETPAGVDYSFSAPGSTYMILRVQNKQETFSYPVYPKDESGLYEGSLDMPLTYARGLITVQVQTAKGQVQAEAQARKGYLAPETPEKQEGRLSGVTVCIDPGHSENGRMVSEPIGPGLSGNTSGTSGMAQGTVTRRKEAIVVLEIAMLLRDELLRQGADVVLTRTTQEEWYTNRERCQIAEDAGAQIMLRLHADTRQSNTKLGFSVYGPLNSTYARAVAEPSVYRHMGELLIDAMKRATGYALEDKYGIVHLNDQFVGNNWAKMTCFLVEMGYMSTPREDYLLSQPVWQQRIAQGMAQGVYEIALYRGWITE